MKDDAARRRELKVFLRARRAATEAPHAGEASRRRRTPGLRREEVAALAGVSVTWYTWLEQGREIQASTETLQRIARALRLTSTDEAYLLSLGGAAPAQVRREPLIVDVRMRAVIDGLTTIPATLFAPNLDVLAYNRAADAIFDFTGYEGRFANNAAWRCFMDPRRRALYEDFGRVAHMTAATLRANHATHMGEPVFEDLLAALREGSPDFAACWNDGRTALLDKKASTYLHPRFGRLRVDPVYFSVPMNPEYLLAALPPSDERTARIFSRMGSKPRVAPRPSKRSRQTEV